jgi:hypothetical protein
MARGKFGATNSVALNRVLFKRGPIVFCDKALRRQNASGRAARNPSRADKLGDRCF